MYGNYIVLSHDNEITSKQKSKKRIGKPWTNIGLQYYEESFEKLQRENEKKKGSSV